MYLERIFLDDRARPDASHELVLGDEFTGRLDQHCKDLQRSAPQRNRNSTGPQFTPSEIQLPPATLVYRVWAVFKHHHCRTRRFVPTSAWQRRGSQ
jgi:hypothetical protein